MGRLSNFILLPGIMAVIACCGAVLAEEPSEFVSSDPGPGWEEIQKLSERLETLEIENEILKQRVETTDSVIGNSNIQHVSFLCNDPNCQCKQTSSLAENLAWQKGEWNIVPFGNLTGEALYTETSTTARPMVLYLNSDSGIPQDRFTAHGQTTALGLNFSGPQIGAFKSGGMILFNFLGDRPVLNQATPFFLRGYGELKNEDWRFTFGQQGDLFNPIDPVTVNFGGHKQAGNAGAFRGSLRAERFMRPEENCEIQLQAALSQQVVNDFIILPVVIGTDNGTPNVEARIGFGFGEVNKGARPLELGVSGVVGETRAIGLVPVVSDTWGVSVDASLSCDLVGIRGEILVGEAIGTYNAGIGQSLNPVTLDAIHTEAGWLEVWLKLTDTTKVHVGYGLDNPRDSDLGVFLNPDTLEPFAGQRARNEVCWVNIICQINSQFEIGLEVSHRETEYIAPSNSNEGMVYHFRSRLYF